LSKERDTLTDLSFALAKINAVQEDQDILRDSIRLQMQCSHTHASLNLNLRNLMNRFLKETEYIRI